MYIYRLCSLLPSPQLVEFIAGAHKKPAHSPVPTPAACLGQPGSRTSQMLRKAAAHSLVYSFLVYLQAFICISVIFLSHDDQGRKTTFCKGTVKLWLHSCLNAAVFHNLKLCCSSNKRLSCWHSNIINSSFSRKDGVYFGTKIWVLFKTTGNN